MTGLIKILTDMGYKQTQKNKWEKKQKGIKYELVVVKGMLILFATNKKGERDDNAAKKELDEIRKRGREKKK